MMQLTEIEQLCFDRAMGQWEASTKRPDLEERDRVGGALQAYIRQATALKMREEISESEEAKRNVTLHQHGNQNPVLEINPELLHNWLRKVMGLAGYKGHVLQMVQTAIKLRPETKVADLHVTSDRELIFWDIPTLTVLVSKEPRTTDDNPT